MVKPAVRANPQVPLKVLGEDDLLAVRTLEERLRLVPVAQEKEDTSLVGFAVADRPLVMGILNVTPDSFSDGGRYSSVDEAVAAGLKMVGDGADVVDVGGESTRPGSLGVSLAEELDRVLPVVEGLCKAGARVSVDTSKAAVASSCLELGAWMINDVTAFGDPSMASVCAAAGCEVSLMHMQGTPATMQVDPQYGDVVAEVLAFLMLRTGFAVDEGVAREKIWIDPGIGFGKTDEHNLTLLRGLGEFVATGFPVLLGVSRKGFLGRLLGGVGVLERLPGALAIQTLAQVAGVRCIRTHDVAETRRAVEITARIV
jgi:dihydropteroate synthase